MPDSGPFHSSHKHIKFHLQVCDFVKDTQNKRDLKFPNQTFQSHSELILFIRDFKMS